ncbi:GNAT family N-acetyltransferase [Streptomyces radicis]|uniref:N-acetyltransferase n=1 Tax=Streptomyces radicis TaxID=1750517 RepID=A0A3A9WGF9_9ACTN|nr:GNAT family N-acetyltransferase [Streptomyces radicis]RKN11900.1 N-acetyltransferase [Streptomyces radicis]RKN26050.1 N-acetyltransferase [Streptomyces radicis]
MAVEIVDVPEARRFEARLTGQDGRGEGEGAKVAGFAEYLRTPELIVFLHTEVDPAHEGQGIGSTLARVSLDAAREAGLRVLATCPFYAGWIGHHPEYADLLYQSRSRVAD